MQQRRIQKEGLTRVDRGSDPSSNAVATASSDDAPTQIYILAASRETTTIFPSATNSCVITVADAAGFDSLELANDSSTRVAEA